MSEDRWTYPAEGDTSPDIDQEMTDAESVAAKQAGRAVVNAQVPAGEQGISSDAPGTNPAEVRRHGDGNVADEAGAVDEGTARRSPTADN